MSISAVPDGFHTITPNIIVERVEDAVSFYVTAFGAEEIMRLTMPDGRIVHCELKFGDSRLNIGIAMDGWPAHPLLAQIFVDDSDAIFKRVVAAGCKPLTQVTDMFFGFREGRVVDPFGNTWTISTRKEDISHDEMQRRLDASFS
jgi:PhnB protein